MMDFQRLSIRAAALMGFGVLVLFSACTHNVKIEPSDKPFIVNLNVKIDHEVKLQIQEKNRDLLDLEDQVVRKKPRS